LEFLLISFEILAFLRILINSPPAIWGGDRHLISKKKRLLFAGALALVIFPIGVYIRSMPSTPLAVRIRFVVAL